MNKTELAGRLAEKTGLAKAQANQVVDALFSADNGIIIETLKGGENIALTGFGSFKTSERAARKGRNPRTGKEIDIAASKNVNFSAGKSLKDSLQG